MKVTVQLHTGDIQVLEGLTVGNNLIGLRVHAIEFETPKELRDLVSPEGQKWLTEVIPRHIAIR